MCSIIFRSGDLAGQSGSSGMPGPPLSLLSGSNDGRGHYPAGIGTHLEYLGPKHPLNYSNIVYYP